MRTILTTIIAFLCVTASDAQTMLYHFPQPGLSQTEVHIGDWTIQGQVDNWSFHYTNDTVVGNDTFSHLVGYSSYFPSEYIYSSGGKVYGSPYEGTNFAHPDSMELIYDFSLNPGDTFHVSRIGIYGTFTVDSVGTILLASGETRKYMELSNSTGRLKWIDGIGDIERGIFYVDDFEGGHELFICSSDSAGPEYGDPNSTFSCNPLQPIYYGGNVSCGIFNFNVNINPPLCSNQCNGSISISSLAGGTPAYAFSWAPNGSTSQSVSGLCSGNYSFTITDSQGNTCTHTFFVPPPNPIHITVQTVSAGCGYNGYACVNVTGGSTPYFYSWTPAGGNQPCTGHYLSWGSYTFEVTDANGCTSYQSVTIPNYPPVYSTETVSQPTCANCCDGNITLNPTGGAGPLTITHPANETWPAAGNFCSGMYHYCVSDSNGCSYCDSVYLSVPLSADQNIPDHSFTFFPDPSSTELDVFISDAVVSDPSIFIYDPQGKLVLEKEHTDYTTQLNVSSLSPGVYFIEVHDGNNVQSRKRFVIAR
ncbi:MAG TPA: T9SS type A sorting domain-containing protein [Bacteroidia bacterium]|jgi:hypothetical protein|nr:T9SS type A sorting domain-containing protein [Bacteroidia bacterium]